jgi:UDP-N-acetylglucosamine--N-acetylmuramyl-(pentapeptide) pyrophosphoryl-undecaprenol N-acetylglucosamine transferase
MPFIDDMAAAYAWADIVICRAGALTIAELAAAKRPAILIPYAHAVDDHQRLNAEHLANSGAAVCIIQAELSKDKLARILNEWLSDREQLLQRSQKAAAMAEPMATKNVVEACLSIISQRRDKA